MTKPEKAIDTETDIFRDKDRYRDRQNDTDTETELEGTETTPVGEASANH